jgi:hypothetical protein
MGLDLIDFGLKNECIDLNSKSFYLGVSCISMREAVRSPAYAKYKSFKDGCLLGCSTMLSGRY